LPAEFNFEGKLLFIRCKPNKIDKAWNGKKNGTILNYVDYVDKQDDVTKKY
jgi:hypothetical protein